MNTIYADDPRIATVDDRAVQYEGETHSVTGYKVETSTGPYLVLDASEAGFGWTICHPEPPYEFLLVSSGLAIGLPDADAAIRALLGPPRLASV